MKAIRLLHTQNIISRHKQRLQQDLAFSVLVENVAYDKLVEVHWAGEDGVWRTLPAEHRASLGSDLEIWCAQAGLIASEDESLPGDIEFALHYRVRGRDFWDNNGSRDYFSNADSGVLLHQDLPLLNVDFNPILHDGQRYYPITVALRHSLQPRHVYIHWTMDNWRSTQVTPCFFHRLYRDKWTEAPRGIRIDTIPASGLAR